MGYFILVSWSLMSGMFPIAAEAVDKSKEFAPSVPMSALRQFSKFYDYGIAALQAHSATLEQSVLPLPIAVDDALFAGPVVILTAVAPEPKSAFGDGYFIPPSVEPLVGPSKTSRSGIDGGIMNDVDMSDTRRKFAWELPLAAFLGLLAGASITVGIHRRSRHATPTPHRGPLGLRAGHRPSAAVSQSDSRAVTVIPAAVRVSVDGYAQTDFGQASFAEVRHGQARSGRSNFQTGGFGQAGFRDVDCGEDGAVYGPYGSRGPVMVVYSEAAGDDRDWAARAASQPGLSESSAPFTRPTGSVMVEKYRIFTLDGGDVRSCQQFTAADDHEALAQARLCEPTKAFELWRGSQFVTRRPSIQ